MQELQASLVSIFDKMPRVDQIQLTEDQEENRVRLNIFYSLIGICLKAYFSGYSMKKALIESLENNYLGITVTSPNLIIADANRWLSLYNLLNDSWLEIESYYVESNLLLPDNIETPGQALEFLITQQAYSQFAECLLDYSRTSFRKTLKDISKTKKLEKKETLNQADKKFMRSLEIDIRNNSPEIINSPGYQFLDTILEICEKSDCRETKKLLKTYRLAEKKKLNESKKLKNIPGNKTTTWIKGNRKEPFESKLTQKCLT